MKTLLLGGARNPFDSAIFHNLSLIALFAWVGLGADALSSSSYGPEEAFLALGQHTYLAIFVVLGIVLTVFVISASYSQIIELFPTGGGGYLVASKLLSPGFGMLSGCALLIDYVLTITISIASGTDAILSFLPAQWHSFKLEFAFAVILILILLNLRGVKESVVPLVPIFLLFIITHVFIIIYAFATHYMSFPVIAQNTVRDVHGASLELGFVGVFLVILHAYSMGAGTYTGIEAVSNAMPILREPRVQTARSTMRYMAISLSFMVFGLMTAYVLYTVAPQPGKTLNAILFESITRDWGNWGYYFVLVTLVSEAALLFVAAQTGFLDGPRVLANMALDRWVPTKFATLSDRFVAQNGVLIMGGAALAMMLLTFGSVRFLVVLYSIAVFITFLLSQSGMVRYWWNSRAKFRDWKRKLLVNGLGLAMTVFILASVTIVKFNEGGWITILITVALAGLVVVIKRHYDSTALLIKKLDTLVPAAYFAPTKDYHGTLKTPGREFDPNDKTAVLLVNGFNGLGLQALSNIFKMFGTIYKNFIFVQIGVIDAGVFKGAEEIESLQAKVKDDVGRYVDIMQQRGYHAEGRTAIGTDVVDEIVRLAPGILERFPNAVFFGGQIVFSNDSLLSRWLHNYTVFASQRRLYPQGIPFIVLPVKV